MSKKKEDTPNNDIIFTKSNSDLRKKHRNLIKGLLNLKETIHLRVQITDNVISIGYDKYIDPPTKGSVNISDNYIGISINILNNIGCIASIGSKSTQFKDKNLYKEIISCAKIAKDRINIELFNSLYSEAVEKLGISRNITLDILDV